MSFKPFERYIMLTRFNCSRLHAKLPKNLKLMGCWTYSMTMGKVSRTSMGNKYQFNRSKTSLISLHAPPIRWPISHNTKTVANASAPTKIIFNSTNGSISSCDWKISNEVNMIVEWNLFDFRILQRLSIVWSTIQGTCLMQKSQT